MARHGMKIGLMIAFAAAQLVYGATSSGQFADQEDPKHAGVTNWNTNSELSFELVRANGIVTLYIEDHDQPVSTTGAKGNLEIVRAGKTTSAVLLASGDNRLTAKVSVRTGDRVAATVTLGNGTLSMGRFVVP